MKYESYGYKTGEVILTFKFAKDENLGKNKADFLALLKEAVADLDGEAQ